MRERAGQGKGVNRSFIFLCLSGGKEVTMDDELNPFSLPHRADPRRPLLGMTVLVVEDSRFASEAIRLMCLRSGARIRRADTLHAAHRHLATYRPAVIIIDVGLPDGSGTDLIRDLAGASPRVGAILGMSGDPDSCAAALAAGADACLAKPIESLGAFQETVLAALPDHMTGGRVAISPDTIRPDPLSLHDDLEHAADIIGAQPPGETVDYIAQFLTSLARSARDADLEQAAARLARARGDGRPPAPALERVAGLIRNCPAPVPAM